MSDSGERTPHEHTEAAHAASKKIDQRAMFSRHFPVSAREALEHSGKGNSKKAAEAHTKSAEFHSLRATDRNNSYNRRQMHSKAAKLHRAAAAAHVPPPPPKDYSNGIKHEDTHIHKGTITHKGEKVGEINQHLKHGYHPVYHLKLNNGHEEHIEMDAHKDMPALAKHVHEKIVGGSSQHAEGGVTDWGKHANDMQSMTKDKLAEHYQRFAGQLPSKNRTKQQIISSVSLMTAHHYDGQGNLKDSHRHEHFKRHGGDIEDGTSQHEESPENDQNFILGRMGYKRIGDSYDHRGEGQHKIKRVGAGWEYSGKKGLHKFPDNKSLNKFLDSTHGGFESLTRRKAEESQHEEDPTQHTENTGGLLIVRNKKGWDAAQDRIAQHLLAEKTPGNTDAVKEHHQVLKNHGWTADKHGIHRHPDRGYEFLIAHTRGLKTGTWEHGHGQKTFGQGDDHKSLDAYLKKLHTTQHEETEPLVGHQIIAEAHGWKRFEGKAHQHDTYHHPQLKDQYLKIHKKTGAWYHGSNVGPNTTVAEGNDHNDLSDHLSGLHATQHAESPTRKEILGHLAEHYKQDAYEKQGGAHAYWLKPVKGRVSLDTLHKHLTSKGIKVSKGYDSLHGKHGAHGFEISHHDEDPESGHQLHVRFHRTHSDALGIDEPTQHAEEEKLNWTRSIDGRGREVHKATSSRGLNYSIEKFKTPGDKDRKTGRPATHALRYSGKGIHAGAAIHYSLEEAMADAHKHHNSNMPVGLKKSSQHEEEAPRINVPISSFGGSLNHE